MFFLSDDERRFVLRKLLPDARRSPVHPDLRGWSWSQPPLAPVYDVRLGVSEIAGRYCGTKRDLYLSRVGGVKAAPNRAMIEGRVLHAAVADQMVRAIRALYTSPVEDALSALEGMPAATPEALGITSVPEPARGGLMDKVAALAEFEHHRIVARVADVLSRQPRVGPSGLVALALPVTVELPLDGRFLGLSGHLSADAVSMFEPMVVDLKLGERRDFHRLATAGYALVIESLFEYPMSLGCVTYARIERGRVSVERDFHIIDDELRQWFVEARDEAMRMVSEEIDPGRPEECYADCPYRGRCKS